MNKHHFRFFALICFLCSQWISELVVTTESKKNPSKPLKQSTVAHPTLIRAQSEFTQCQMQSFMDQIHFQRTQMQSCSHMFVLWSSTTAREPFKDLLTLETTAASSCDIFVSFLQHSVGFIASGLHYQTPPPSFPPRRAPGVFEASATSFCSYLVWSGPVAPGWRAEGGWQASGEESPGFLLVWEAWRRITKRGHEILKKQGAERWANAQTERHTETHSHTPKIQRNTQKHMHS